MKLKTLSNLNIRTQIKCVIGMLLLIMFTMGFALIINLNKVVDMNNTLFEKPMTNLSTMMTIKDNILQVDNSVLMALTNNTPLDSSYQTNINAITTMTEQVTKNAIDQSSTADAAKSMLGQFDQWSASINTIASLINAGDYDQARSIYTQESLAYRDNTLERITSNIALASSNATKLYQQTQTTADHAKRVLRIIFGASIIVSLMCLFYILRNITRPLELLIGTLEQVSQGHLDQHVNYDKHNEFGILAEHLNQLTDTLNHYINNITGTLSKVACNDLTTKIEMDYIGDFAPMKSAINDIIDSLQDVISQINGSTALVLKNAENVSQTAQSLSQGATEQASSIEELAATINEVSDQVQHTAEQANSASHKAQEVGEKAAASNQQIHTMVQAMEEINDSSMEIGKIIKTIEDIAFQTNILALNAAVEAARAGSAGKGFAVVADEVRNLASKSAEASKSTASLIESSLQAVQNGSNIVDHTVTALGDMVQSVHQVTDVINHISQAADSQAESIQQVTMGIEQISGVVQLNSATAESSATASAELTEQAQNLENLVNKFNL